MEIKTIKIKDLATNDGQIEGLPKNPRQIRDHRYEKLKKSIEDAPEMLQLRELLVYPHGGKFVIIGGNMRYRACKEIGYKELPCKVLDAETPVEKLRQYAIKDNENFGEYDWDEVANNWDTSELEDWGVELPTDWGAELDGEGIEQKEIVEDEIPENVETKCKKGEIWQLGRHRLMCGDSTDGGEVALLMNREKADLVFTDPPYGMKKESEGIINDNLNYDDLLEFNKKWIPNTFAFLKHNGSWYCWGTDEPLMDIYSEILKPRKELKGENKLTFRNLITWDKGNSQGQKADTLRQYAVADEKCLFVMMGRQTYGETEADYWEGFEPIRQSLISIRDNLNMSTADVVKYAGATTCSHWFARSQFEFPSVQRFSTFCDNMLKAERISREEYDKVREEYDKVREEYDKVREEWYKTRAYFDNTHDNMNNVWHFDRTNAKERQDAGNHATPKPIALCARAIKTSSRENEIVLDVFGGSGSTLIACEQLNRTCYMMELDPHYCDVIIARWEKLSGGTAIKIEDV